MNAQHRICFTSTSYIASASAGSSIGLCSRGRCGRCGGDNSGGGNGRRWTRQGICVRANELNTSIVGKRLTKGGGNLLRVTAHIDRLAAEGCRIFDVSASLNKNQLGLLVNVLGDFPLFGKCSSCKGATWGRLRFTSVQVVVVRRGRLL